MRIQLLNSYTIYRTSPQVFRRELMQFYNVVLEQFDHGDIDHKELAYQIAATLQFIGALTRDQEKLGTLAGELELPNGHISGNIEEKEQRMLEMVREQVNNA